MWFPGQLGNSSAGPLTSHPRLFYNAASLQHLRQALATDGTANAEPKKRGEELLSGPN